MNIKYDVTPTSTGNVRERILRDFLASDHKNMVIDYSLDENGKPMGENNYDSRKNWEYEAHCAITTFKRIIKEQKLPLTASKRHFTVVIERIEN